MEMSVFLIVQSMRSSVPNIVSEIGCTKSVKPAKSEARTDAESDLGHP
jgi:hypothetical protein